MNCDCIEKMNEKLKDENLRLIGHAFTVPDFNLGPTVDMK